MTCNQHKSKKKYKSKEWPMNNRLNFKQITIIVVVMYHTEM